MIKDLEFETVIPHRLWRSKNTTRPIYFGVISTTQVNALLQKCLKENIFEHSFFDELLRHKTCLRLPERDHIGKGEIIFVPSLNAWQIRLYGNSKLVPLIKEMLK